MLALIESETTVRKKGSLQIENKKILNMNVLHTVISVPQKSKVRSRQLYKQTAKLLKEYGVITLCFREDFTERDFFLNQNFEQADMKKLIAAKSVDIIQELVPDGTEFALLAERADEESVCALEKACLKFRRVTAHLGLFTEMVCSELERRLGISVKIAAGENEWLKADGAVIFHRGTVPAVFRPEVPVLFVSGMPLGNIRGGKAVEGAEFFTKGEIPPGYSAPELVAEAFNEGCLRESEIGVKNPRLV